MHLLLSEPRYPGCSDGATLYLKTAYRLINYLAHHSSFKIFYACHFFSTGNSQQPQSPISKACSLSFTVSCPSNFVPHPCFCVRVMGRAYGYALFSYWGSFLVLSFFLETLFRWLLSFVLENQGWGKKLSTKHSKLWTGITKGKVGKHPYKNIY